jgi:hypothetical protein
MYLFTGIIELSGEIRLTEGFVDSEKIEDVGVGVVAGRERDRDVTGKCAEDMAWIVK